MWFCIPLWYRYQVCIYRNAIPPCVINMKIFFHGWNFNKVQKRKIIVKVPFLVLFLYNKKFILSSFMQCTTYFLTCLPAWLLLTKLVSYYLNYCVLFLSPSLTWRDVQHIIVRSARHAPEGVPLTSGFWVKNKAGLWFSRYFGFGLMDGGMMVYLAKQWNTVPSQLRCEIKGRDENRFGLFFILFVVVADDQ